jgi:hypothetical protein
VGAPLVTLTEIKTYLGKTGTDDDVLIASIASNASAMAERDTGRIFAVSSNVTTRYSTDGQRSLTIHDRPYNDTTRVVQLGGVTRTEGTNVWFLPDRRNEDVVATVQLEYYDTSGNRWFAAHFNWFDANLDSPKLAGGTPNDLVITGTVGHPVLAGDVRMAVLELAAWLYWRAKGGASAMSVNFTGEEIDLSLLPQAYQNMVRNWKLRTAVALV